MTATVPTIVDRVQHVIQRLTQVLEGDVDATSLTRAMYSSDTSNYRVVPDIVVLPRHAADVEATLQVAREYALPITARGGGTSIAGNAVGPGLVLDFSRYMNQVLDSDIEYQTAVRSEEHTSELQSRGQLVCRLLLEKKRLEDTD